MGRYSLWGSKLYSRAENQVLVRTRSRSWKSVMNKSPSYETVLRRWPTIITSVIDELHQQCHNLSLVLKNGVDPKDVLEAKIKEALGIVNEISKLKYEMARDRPLKSVQILSPRRGHEKLISR